MKEKNRNLLIQAIHIKISSYSAFIANPLILANPKNNFQIAPLVSARSIKEKGNIKCVIQVSALSYKRTYVNKGANTIISANSCSNTQNKLAEIELLEEEVNDVNDGIDKTYSSKRIIVKYDYLGQIAVVVINSKHMFYCQILFINPKLQNGRSSK